MNISLNMSEESPRNDSSKENVIVLAYVNRIFPYVSRNPWSGHFSGIYIEMWKSLAKCINKTIEYRRGDVYGGYQLNKNGFFGGILELVQNGSADAVAEGYSYRKERMRLLYYTQPMESLEMVSVLIVSTIDRVAAELRRKANKKRRITEMFQGAILLTIVGKREKAAETSTILEEIFGKPIALKGGDVIVEPDPLKLLGMPCREENTILFITHYMAMSIPPRAVDACPLARVDTSGEQFSPETFIGQAAFGKEWRATFYMNKKLGFKARNLFNTILLTMFNQEMITKFWWSRFTSRPREELKAKAKFDFTPMPLSAFHTIFIICGGVYALAVIAFLAELKF